MLLLCREDYQLGMAMRMLQLCFMAVQFFEMLPQSDSCENQVSLGAGETVNAKIEFED